MAVREVRVCDICGKVSERAFNVEHGGLTIHQANGEVACIKEGDYCDICFGSVCGIKNYMAPSVKWNRDGSAILLNECHDQIPAATHLTVRGDRSNG